VHPATIFHETDAAELARRARASGLALIIGVDRGRPLIAHAPVLLDDVSRLRFHLGAANPLSPVLAASGRAMVVITGDDAYVSPDWYETPDQVPTWNYESVEIEGQVRVLDRAEATALLDDLSARHEAPLAPKPPWTRAKMNPARFEALLSGITAFELAIGRLAGVTKLGQNKSPDMMRRVAAALAEREAGGAQAIAAAMLRRLAAG
jgi:transcriptional regulator